jgi:mannan endo-1,4-beta-mannosidase
MWIFKIIVLSLACFAASTPTPTEDTGFVSKASIPSATGLKFNIDGTTGYFAGTNSYWIGFLTNNADVDLVMTHLKASGLKILRVWGNNLLLLCFKNYNDHSRVQ